MKRIHVRAHRKDGGDQRGGSVQTSSSVPSFIRPYVTDILERGQSLSETPRTQFPESTVVPFSPETEAALAGITSRAQEGSPLVGQAQQQQQDVLSGAYLDPFSNPAYQGVIDAVTSDVLPQTYTQFASGGQHFGSPVEAEAVARGLGRGLAPFAFQHYGTERAAQEAAAGRAPGLAAVDYADLEALRGVGAEREGQRAAEIDESYRRFLFEQEEPRQRLQEFANLVFGGGASAPRDVTQTQVARGGNPAAQTVGSIATLIGALGG